MTKVEQDDFDEIKRIVARNTLSSYPYFNGVFKIKIDDIVFQLGAVIRQEGKPISLYSIELTDNIKWYTLTQRESY